MGEPIQGAAGSESGVCPVCHKPRGEKSSCSTSWTIERASRNKLVGRLHIHCYGWTSTVPELAYQLDRYRARPEDTPDGSGDDG